MAEAFKKCFRCGQILPLSMFYAHPQMADGHLNKFKVCAKEDVHENYMKKIENKEYVEKERARGREKYRRLNYKGISRNDYKTKDVRRDFKVKNGNISTSVELHHWNYNELKSVIPLDRRVHHRLHNLIELDSEKKIFFVKGTKEMLDTKEKHFRFIIKNFPLATIHF